MTAASQAEKLVETHAQNVRVQRICANLSGKVVVVDINGDLNPIADGLSRANSATLRKVQTNIVTAQRLVAERAQPVVNAVTTRRAADKVAAVEVAPKPGALKATLAKLRDMRRLREQTTSIDKG